MKNPVVRSSVARQALVLLTLLSGAFAPLLASSPAPAAGTADASAQVLALAKQRLNLTPAQAEKFGPLADAHVRKIRALFEEYAGGGAALLPSFVQDFQKTRDDFRAAVQPILTEPQRAEFDRLRQEVDAAIRDVVCDQRIASLKGRLGLSPKQETDLRPILLDDFDKKRALVSVPTRPSDGPRAQQARLEAAQKIQAGTEDRLRTVLTAAQMSTYLQDLGRTPKAEDSGAPQQR